MVLSLIRWSQSKEKRQNGAHSYTVPEYNTIVESDRSWSCNTLLSS